nr:heavy-metal-associated domain-containing protein [Saprospiraceae bacterium]
MKVFYLISISLFMWAFTACGGAHGSGELQSQVNENFDGITATMEVGEMSCMSCVKKVTDALSDLDGVANITVSLEDELATFDYDPEVISLDAIARVITDLDYVVGAYGPKEAVDEGQ